MPVFQRFWKWRKKRKKISELQTEKKRLQARIPAEKIRRFHELYREIKQARENGKRLTNGIGRKTLRDFFSIKQQLLDNMGLKETAQELKKIDEEISQLRQEN